MLPSDVVDLIRATPISLSPDQEDNCLWPHSESGMVMFSSAFSFISGTLDADLSLAWIWDIKSMEKIKLFMWKISKNGLMVNAERKRRDLMEIATCPVCNVDDESLDHLFRHYRMAENCWNLVSTPPNFLSSFHLPLDLWMKEACSTKVPIDSGIQWNALFPLILWNLWKGRNDSVFNDKAVTPHEILHYSIRESKEYAQLLLSRKDSLMASQQWVRWSPLEADIIKINFDGAMKACYHLASAGGLLRNHNGDWVVGYTCNIGIANNFSAELWGLREGLLIAKNQGFTKIIAETDSDSLVQVLSKDSTETASILVNDCKRLLGLFQSAMIVHIFHEGNQCVDFLANMGQNAPWGTTVLEQPLDGLNNLFSRDIAGVACCRRR